MEGNYDKTKELWLMIKELDKTSKLLVRRDLELTETNEELDKKYQELETEKEKVENIFKNLFDGLIFFDNNNKVIIANPSAKKIFGANFKEIAEKKIICEKDEDIKIKEIEFQKKIFQVSTIKIFDTNKNLIGYLKVFHDITREKEIDKLKSNFITVAAHQLRTPLSVVKWVFKMILNGDVGKISAEQQDLIQKGDESNEKMISLINSLLDISRVEEGKFGYILNKVNVTELIQKSIDFFFFITNKKYINLILKNNLGEAWIEADQEKLFLVFQNLIDNAIKYSPAGGNVIIEIDKNRNKLLVKIIDRGIGIPKEEQNKLFVKFSRGSNAKRVFTDGSGLGLFIAKNIVEKHQGKIWFESEENKGTTFYVEFPLVKK